MSEGKSAAAVSSAVDSSDAVNVTYLKDYQSPAYLIERCDLSFDIYPEYTRVSSSMRVVKSSNIESSSPSSDNKESTLRLDGEGLLLRSVAIDGVELLAEAYQVDEKSLTLSSIPERFDLKIVNDIDPEKNLSLEGLYLSDGMYCTQCEAEGFRRITYFLDRPDVMSVFSTRISADKTAYPILLSNGNETGRGDLEGGRHWLEWQDPFKKPCYLFALVAGRLQAVEDNFITQSGRGVKLQIFVEAKDVDKCDHAMQSLKRAMRWDEDVYGREYDLDLYMIVAVDFFNMGAMENKGLNIFNTSCVLAHPKTQTDLAFQRVEAVIAHEYFHNWSGNRVTCRDWFQLSLKEGFTVFRDACFSADMNSPTVKRIEDVSLLTSAQFAEDGGPMSHPIRPESYMEISNFYTLTIYEKGAEVIRMMHQLLGAEKFRLGSDLYFDRHDGQAVTCEDFVCAMESASGVDLKQFRRWYSQSGTPELSISTDWNAEQGQYSITVKQACPDSSTQQNKKPFYIPLRMALVSESGLLTINSADTASSSSNTFKINHNEQVLAVTQVEQTWHFNDIFERPVPSLLRGFSAPVKLEYEYQHEELLLLLKCDSDGFTRWDASRRIILSLIREHVSNTNAIDADVAQQRLDSYVSVLSSLVSESLRYLNSSEDTQGEFDIALLAEILSLPSYSYVIEQYQEVDIDAIGVALESIRIALADRMEVEFLAAYRDSVKQLANIGTYRPEAGDIALRQLKNVCLAYLLRASSATQITLASEQCKDADNMTDQLAALGALVNCPNSQADASAKNALDRFYQQWQSEQLVVNTWLTVQVSSDKPGALQRVKDLMMHSAYDETNPNKVRALIGGFCVRNPLSFHAEDGSGYTLLCDEVIRLNAINPQLASRMLAPLTQWQKFTEPRRELMRKVLQRITEEDGLSADVYEVVSKSLRG